MKSVVCTLYEGNYHLGVAALVNSLYNHGYRGVIFIGYRGSLPRWATNAKPDISLQWEKANSLIVLDDLILSFLPLDTDCHLTNYKPKFILDLWKGPAKHADSIFYFDPDIINKCRWEFYERWVQFGVALVHEVVWNDMPYNHPKRMQWKDIAVNAGYEVENKISSYINAGFIGVSKEQVEFVKLWQNLIEYSISNYGFDNTKFYQNAFDSGLFKAGDQDILNLSVMCTKEPLSEMGPEAMDFRGGGWLMSHATGSPKPWKKNFLKQSFKGLPPSSTDKLFWKSCASPIRIYSNKFIKLKAFELLLSTFINRFYRK